MRPGQSAAIALLTVLLVACTPEVRTAAPATASVEPSAPPVTALAPSAATGGTSGAATSSVPVSSPDPLTAGRDDIPAADDIPSRVVVESLGIDLPIVSGDLQVPGNAPDYPLCDVAQYLTTYRYPGRLGTTTWIYGHARSGMFLPMLEASQRDAGASLVGAVVDVYSSGNRRYRYEVRAVHPHSTDRSIARNVAPEEGRLVLQTSEGPRGTVPKLQVSAVLIDVTPASPADAGPPAEPRECFD